MIVSIGKWGGRRGERKIGRGEERESKGGRKKGSGREIKKERGREREKPQFPQNKHISLILWSKHTQDKLSAIVEQSSSLRSLH